MTAAALPATLVTGASAAAREAGIQASLARAGQGGSAAVILEGLPDPRSILTPSSSLEVHRVAPGCVCCSGNLVLRVTLNRVLRRRPERLYIGLASTEHLDQLRSWLQQPPYDQLLELTPDLST
ncbi:GTP-binding protein [Massilia sp. RP-1-19]|uniref:GTP-binding protein n=1 Tax=Massilia polaris TaxID=2728846 RepID=A0A848HQ40_9BURK|nr:GTPase [Massilia polaris]NML63234.1 GTP-binding protein [Massilia polaris]